MPATPSVMTVGELSRRTGVPVKALREYTDWGLIYTIGRSASNYRLYDNDALWCVRVIRDMRSLGLTLAEIRELAHSHAERSDRIGPYLARLLRAARARLDERIAELQQMRRHIHDFEATHQAELTGRPGTEIWTDDPQRHTSTAAAHSWQEVMSRRAGGLNATPIPLAGSSTRCQVGGPVPPG